jgi:hypothetical protein
VTTAILKPATNPRPAPMHVRSQVPPFYTLVFLRDLEYHLDGTAGRSTSRLSKKLGNMGVSDTLRVVEAKSVRDGKVTHEEWTALLSAYMDMMRSRDALATTGT